MKKAFSFYAVFWLMTLSAFGATYDITSSPSGSSPQDSLWLVKQIAETQAGGTIDLQNKELHLSGFTVTKNVTMKNAKFVQTDANIPCLIVDFRSKNYGQVSALENVAVTGVPGAISKNNLIDRNFAVLQIYTDKNDVSIKQVSVSGAAKQGLFISVDGGGMVISNCRFEQNGNLVRDSLLLPMDGQKYSAQVHNAAQFKPGDRVWLGDELNQIAEVKQDQNVIVFKNDGSKRLVVAKTPAQLHYAGQYITRYKNFFNGAYIIGEGKMLRVEGTVFSNNSHFGLFNCFNGPFQIVNSSAMGNGYIGLGNKTGNNFVFQNCVVGYNSNNGLDINKASNGNIESCKAINNGVDGLFVGQGDHVTLQKNSASGQKRIGILLNGTPPKGVSNAVITGNTVTENRIGICLTSVSNSQIQSNTIGQNAIGLKIMGQNNAQNPSELDVNQNDFKNNSDKDIYANVRGYLNGGAPGKLRIENTGSDQRKRALSKLKTQIYE